jgi:hypothetical protein
MVASSEAMTARTALTSIAASSAKWEIELVRLNAVSVLADAALALQVKCTKKDTESQRIATAKIERARGKLADLRRSELEDRTRANSRRLQTTVSMRPRRRFDLARRRRHYDPTDRSSRVLPLAMACRNHRGRWPCPVQVLPCSSRKRIVEAFFLAAGFLVVELLEEGFWLLIALPLAVPAESE